MTREYDKLVRDGIPGIIEADGETPVVHTASGDEYERRLGEKLAEEVAEYRESGDVEELADVLEVVHALREQHGVSGEELQEIRERKADDRGRFDDGVVLERVLE
ncbi:nucleoside triphosphate pyrophosphohydrolase [Haloparvum sp. PAK95]|uniref:nucleoside triphosphate pyrophosphohydrolase n=1 Tax=Haloparvum sp. PAK95 TaxID=3418962 RepID=UPI003D2F355A